MQLFYKNSTDTNIPPLHIPHCGTKCPLQKMYDLYGDILPTQNFDDACKLREGESLPPGGNPENNALWKCFNFDKYTLWLTYENSIKFVDIFSIQWKIARFFYCGSRSVIVLFISISMKNVVLVKGNLYFEIEGNFYLAKFIRSSSSKYTWTNSMAYEKQEELSVLLSSGCSFKR